MGSPPSRMLVYGDFSSLRCYLASQRVDALRGRGLDPRWRAVEQHPGLSVKGRRGDEATSSAVERVRADLLTRLRVGETLPERMPDLVPNTRAAVSAYAEGCGAGVGDQIRRLLFSAYWTDGTDIGDPEVLRTLLAATFMRGEATCDPIREFGYAVAMTRAPISGAAWRRIVRWRQELRELGPEELPVVTIPPRVEAGDEALGWLEQMLGQAPSTDVAADGTTPSDSATSHWRPPTTALPPATWTSQVGDPWNRTWLMTR